MAAPLGFKTFTTGEVLTAADTNGYLMQGVLVFDDAAARDAAITSPQEGQFAYLKDTNVTTYYTGSAWANLDTTGMVNPMTTTGDIIYSSSGSTPARLGIGTNGQVLTVTGGVPVWGSGGAGNLTETVFTASDATYAIPAGVTGIWALVVGGGGGGGASATATATNAGGGGGAGQILEKFFAIAGGDTTLNITVGAGGAGGATSGAKGSSGATSSIVGNTSATTYASASGGGGGGGGATANLAGISGASGGGNGITTSNTGGSGGGFAGAPAGVSGVLGGGNPNGGGATATTMGVTGFNGAPSFGTASQITWGASGINIWGRALAGGGSTVSDTTNGIAQNFGVGANTLSPSAGNSATANTGAGGNAGKTNATTFLAGGDGGSGLVVLRYVL
jgi:hypothetical protein